MDSRDMRAGRAPSAWAGWVVFAGTMAIIAGVFNIIQFDPDNADLRPRDFDWALPDAAVTTFRIDS